MVRGAHPKKSSSKSAKRFGLIMKVVA